MRLQTAPLSDKCLLRKLKLTSRFFLHFLYFLLNNFIKLPDEVNKRDILIDSILLTVLLRSLVQLFSVETSINAMMTSTLSIVSNPENKKRSYRIGKANQLDVDYQQIIEPSFTQMA